MTKINKIAALDLGDKWVGIAISDPLQLFARPYTTIEASKLIDFIKTFKQQEDIKTIVIGLPQTLRGTESEQTTKIRDTAAQLELLYPEITWKLWDERLTSKQAATLKKTKTKEDKMNLHAIAAALFLNSYLESLQFQKIRD